MVFSFRICRKQSLSRLSMLSLWDKYYCRSLCKMRFSDMDQWPVHGLKWLQLHKYLWNADYSWA